MAEDIILEEEEVKRQDGETYWDENGRIYVTAFKKVWADEIGSGGTSSDNEYNSYWHIQSVASSRVSMRALNENEDWNVYAHIKGTADRGQRQPPPLPSYPVESYKKTTHTSDGIGYSGKMKRRRVCWIKNFFENFRTDQEMSTGGYTDTWTEDWWPNPFDPYAYAWAESEWGDYVGGSAHTDVSSNPWDEN